MKFSIRLWPLLFVAPSLLAASASAEGRIHRLPDAKAAKTISLNPDYYVFGESLAGKEKKLPLLITLHGAGGTGLNIVKCKGRALKLIDSMGRAEIESLVVAPQASKSPRAEGAKGGWVPADLDILFAHLIETLAVDTNRIYLTGNSMGGYGTYAWAGASPAHFAAIAPMVGGLGALGPKDITPDLELWGKNLAGIPLRAYYGANDRVVPADRGAMILKAIEKAGGKKAKIIVLKDEGHGAGGRAYSDPEFFRWLFSHKRGKS